MINRYISYQAAIDVIEALEEPAPTAQHLSAIFDCEDAIKSLEPADVAPVVHSQWKYKCGEIQCPECGNRIHRIDLSGYLNFCPNCGVKMDGEE